MGKTYRENVIWPRSVSYKSEHNRGWAREKDRHSHHSQRNLNRICDDSTFVPFGREYKRENAFGLQFGTNVYNCDYNLDHFYQNHKGLCEWTKLPMKQSLTKAIKSKELEKGEKNYLTDTLRQVERRGAPGRFVGHNRDFEKFGSPVLA
jgi:hypothetical protein